MKIYAVVGSPGSGKSWVCNQIKDRFTYVSNDAHIGKNFVEAIIREARNAKLPLVIDIPFSISQIKEPLERAGLNVETVFIIESENTLRDRYMKRERRDIPAGHLTRQKTYLDRARESKSFMGTSSEVLTYLKSKSAQ